MLTVSLKYTRSYLLISIAPTGQNCAHEPHLMHFFGSIVALPLTSLIAFTGQIEAQAPQPIHFFSSTILSPFV